MHIFADGCPYSEGMPRKSELAPNAADKEMLGQRMAQVRKEKGLTQVELAERTGLIQVVVSDYECGRLRLPADMALRFAEVLGVTVMGYCNPAGRPAPRSRPGSPAPSSSAAWNRSRTCPPTVPIAPAPQPVQSVPAQPSRPKKGETPEAAVPQEKGGAQYRRAITLDWNKPEAPAAPKLTQEPTPPQPNMGQVAAEFLEQLELYREGLDAEGRDLSEDEVRPVQEHWATL